MDSLARARERPEIMIIMTMTNIASPREYIWAAHRQTDSARGLPFAHFLHIDTRAALPHLEHKGKEDGQTLSFGSSGNSEVI